MRHILKAILLVAGVLTPAQAVGETESMIGELIPVAFSFCPKEHLEANGALLPINDDHAQLFSVIGTTYGGDGRTTFALPDLRARSPMGPARNDYSLGQKRGFGLIDLDNFGIPPHSHRVEVANVAATEISPENAFPAKPQSQILYHPERPPSKERQLDIRMIKPVQTTSRKVFAASPYLTIRWCIVLKGQFPVRR